MDVAESRITTQRKEVKIMKLARSFFVALLFTNTFAVISTGIAADGILSKGEFNTGSYCHEEFPAIRRSTLADDQPVLKDPGKGDVIDFYGSCDENPVGKDQVQAQRLEDQHRFANDYED
jgi:hypothetical protein